MAVGYVIQKGKFESTKAPFPGDFYREERESVKYERRNTSTLIYYRYNFILAEDNGGPSAVNATVVISYDPSNSNFIVTDYHYKIDYDGNEDQNQAVTEVSVDTENVLIDTRTLTGDGHLAKILTDAFNEKISEDIEIGWFPEANYTIIRVYHAYSIQFDGVEDINEEGEINEEAEDDDGIWPSQGYKHYDFWVKFKRSKGKYYLMMINIHYIKDKETGEFGPEIFSITESPRLD